MTENGLQADDLIDIVPYLTARNGTAPISWHTTAPRLLLSVLTVLELAACQNFSGTHTNTKPSTDGPAILSDVDAATDTPPKPDSGTGSPTSFKLPIPTSATPNDTQFAQLKTEDDSWSIEKRLEYERNLLVGRYLAESDGLCAEYLQELTRTQRTYSLLLGSLSTIFGGAGAAFTRASVVRPLSALASISSGERAEFDADTFAKQTSQVIISAIKNSRARTYNNMVQVNFLKPINAWPVSVALADVQDYHSRCSLNEGITEAAASITATSPKSNSQPSDPQAGISGRSESPPTTDSSIATGAKAATQGAVGALLAADAPAKAVAAGAVGALAGGATATAGNTSPTAATDAGAKAASEIAAPVPAPSPAQHPAASTYPALPAGVSPTALARVQLALDKWSAKADVAPIVVDGAWGKYTSDAISAFQSAQVPPLRASGVPDSATLQALAITAPAPAAAPATTDSAVIKKVQMALSKQPLAIPTVVKPTGVVDAATVGALIVYQDFKRQPLTGVIDSQTLSNLRIAP